MYIGFLITPLFAWLVAGCMKFAINSFKAKKLAFKQIGYGGMPSNHTSIVSSALSIVALKEGLDSPIIAVAVALAFVVMLDAASLRKKMEQQAIEINKLLPEKKLRERLGHTPVEIMAGFVVGSCSAYFIYLTV